MKIQKITKLCKQTKIVAYATTDAGLWLGNGDCAYLISAFENLDTDGIALALGIGEKDKGKFLFAQMQLETFNLADIDKAETPCEQIDFTISHKNALPYKTEEGVRFIAADMLEVLKDEIENLEIYMRRTTDGRAYFAAKIGMYICAFFEPQRIISADFIDKLNAFNNLCRVTYQNDESNLQACAPVADETQMRLEGAEE